MHKPGDFIAMPVPASMFTAVCALLGGASLNISGGDPKPSVTAPKPEPAGTATVAGEPSAEEAALFLDGDNTDKIDAYGHPLDETMHTGTMTTKGLWRMKVGVPRPAPMAGFPKGGAAVNGADATGLDTGAASSSGTPADAGDDEDEFAAFRAAADASNATDVAAAAGVPARKWTDADLGALCNQAAAKLNDPAPVKAIIGDFVPEGAAPHSRNIPDDKREEFAKAVEAKAGIEFAG